MRISIIYFMFCAILFIPGVVSADTLQGIGDLADNMMEPVGVLADFITTGSLIIGASFIFSAFLKYMQYRVNPMASPISTVIFLVIFGVVLLCLPLARNLINDKTPIPALQTVPAVPAAPADSGVISSPTVPVAQPK